ncbi:MAG: DUF2461 domain-containing protein [Bacteroidota bacterium]
MLQPATTTFIRQLAENNNKLWFDKHREDYAAAKEDFETFTTAVLNGLAADQPIYKEQKAKDCIFRIFRDVRFAKDKTPYKDHFGAFFSRGGRKFPGAGYYIHIQPGGKSFAGGGLWHPEAPLLKGVRQEIDYNFDEFKGIVADKKFRKLFAMVNGEQLKNPPQGYDAENPAIEYLKMKGYTVGYELADSDLTSKTFVKKVVDTFTVMRPFIDFLNRPLG